MSPKKNTVNWTFENKPVLSIADMPVGAVSFIYKVTLEDNRYYIGRKTVLKPNYTSGKLKGQCKGEYSWKSYCGSSKELSAIIKSGVKYKKEIIKYCFSKAETTYSETAEILCSGALTDPNCFNFWVKATIYSKHLKPNS